MPSKPFIILQPAQYIEHEADDETTALALAEQLSADQPGLTFDVYERVSTTVAPVPEKPIVVPVTTRLRSPNE